LKGSNGTRRKYKTTKKLMMRAVDRLSADVRQALANADFNHINLHPCLLVPLPSHDADSIGKERHGASLHEYDLLGCS
jgi:hypothetical protein